MKEIKKTDANLRILHNSLGEMREHLYGILTFSIAIVNILSNRKFGVNKRTKKNQAVIVNV